MSEIGFVREVVKRASTAVGRVIILSDEMLEAIAELTGDYTVEEVSEMVLGELFGVDGREVA